MTSAVLVDRYREHGLTHNPFAFDIEQQQTVFVSRGLAAPPAARSSTMVQIIGDRGAGKTSQLQQWRREQPGPYFYVPSSPTRERWRSAPVAPLVYADEIDRMPRPLRSRWFRRLARAHTTVVIGTHRDLSSIARRNGLAVVTHHLGSIDFATLRLVVDKRLRAAMATDSSTGDYGLVIADQDLQRILGMAGGSLRNAERHLHELVAERVLAS